MWIKICGTTNIDDAQHAADAGADALGFVFAPSPRRVTEAQARHIVSHLSSEVETYGVFVDASIEEIVHTVLACGLTGVQLHRTLNAGQESFEPALPEKLRRHFLARCSQEVRIVSVVAFDEALEDQFEGAARSADALLIDSRLGGGSGIRFDWAAARASFQKARGKSRVIAAGGLSPENVEEAIETLAPWGVDVVTGVEASPGRKDPRKVEAFIQAARRSVALLQ